MSNKKVAVVCGTRPEIIKMAPVYQALRETPGLEPVLVHTGQHTDLAHPLYRLFGMRVDHDLVLERSKPTLAHLSQRLLEKTSEVFEQLRPHAVLVHGDTSTAAMAAMAAFYERIPVGHVEAGLRTYERYSPFPEEMNRSLIGRMAHWHYAPTERSRQALLRENIDDAHVLVTGNTVVDAARLTAQLLGDGADEPFVAAEKLHERCNARRLVLVTAHRRENWGEGLRQIAHAVADLLQRYDDWLVVWPLHANPEVASTVRDVIAERGVDDRQLLLTQPLDYTALVWVLSRAWATLTDSGGIQEEAAAFGVPVVVLRESTERPELIEAGGGVLTGARRDVIVQQVARLAEDAAVHAGMKGIDNPFGDGRAAQRIAAHLRRQLA